MVDEWSFEELVTALAELDGKSDDLDLEEVIARAKIDRRLMRLLSEGDTPNDERRTTLRVPGRMRVHLVVGDRTIDATLLDLGEGGLRVEVAPPLGQLDELDVELVEAEPPAPRARARVSWRKEGEAIALGLQFVAQTAAHRRRMRHLVIEILRRLHQSS